MPLFGDCVYISRIDMCDWGGSSGIVHFPCWHLMKHPCFFLVLVISPHRTLQVWLSQLIPDKLGTWPAAWQGRVRYGKPLSCFLWVQETILLHLRKDGGCRWHLKGHIGTKQRERCCT